jgi:hypothetical protein
MILDADMNVACAALRSEDDPHTAVHSSRDEQEIHSNIHTKRCLDTYTS